MKGKTSNSRYRFGGGDRNIGGVKVPQYGTNKKITDMAEGKSTGIQTDGQSGIQRYDRPGRKHGGSVENFKHSRQHEFKKDNEEHEWGEDGYKDGGKPFNPGGEKGKLHRELGISTDKKIPAKRLGKAEHSKNPEIRRDAIRAATMKKWHHGG